MAEHLRRLSRAWRARIGTLLGIVLVAVGVFLQFDLGYALMVLGGALVIWFLLLYDVDERKEPPQ